MPHSLVRSLSSPSLGALVAPMSRRDVVNAVFGNLTCRWGVWSLEGPSGLDLLVVDCNLGSICGASKRSSASTPSTAPPSPPVS